MIRRALTATAVASLLAGCTITAPRSQNVPAYRGPAPYQSLTPTDAALRCLRPHIAKLDNVRIGVADFVDGTGAGAGENDIATRMLSQRPDLMLMVALRKAGVRLVNRTSIGVAEWEMKEAMAKRLGEGRPVTLDNNQFAYRPIQAGGVLGSTYYLNGAITEYNYNISNSVAELGGLGIFGGRRTYRASVAVDLAVTKSMSTEVVLARSYAKQLEGQEVGGGVFRFVDLAMGLTTVELFEANVGEKRNEPVQTALRWVIETAAYDLLSELAGRHPECEKLLPGFRDETNVPYAGAWNETARQPTQTDTQTQGNRIVSNDNAPAASVAAPSPSQAVATAAPSPVDALGVPPRDPRPTPMPAPQEEQQTADSTIAPRPVALVPPPPSPPLDTSSSAAPPPIPVVSGSRSTEGVAPEGIAVEMQSAHGCSRLAIDLPPGVALSFSKEGAATQLRFDPPVPVLLQGVVPRLFESVTAAPGTLTLNAKNPVWVSASAKEARLLLTAGRGLTPLPCMS